MGTLPVLLKFEIRDDFICLLKLNILGLNSYLFTIPTPASRFPVNLFLKLSFTKIFKAVNPVLSFKPIYSKSL